MTLKYTVLGAGAMGLRFGNLLIIGHPKLRLLRPKAGSTFPAITKIVISYPSRFLVPKNTMVPRMSGLSLPSK